jgi:hypothetical protein
MFFKIAVPALAESIPVAVIVLRWLPGGCVHAPIRPPRAHRPSALKLHPAELIIHEARRDEMGFGSSGVRIRGEGFNILHSLLSMYIGATIRLPGSGSPIR